MVLIISDKYDQSTTYVIEWLEFYNKKWIRANEDDVVDVDFLGQSLRLKNGKFQILFSEIESVWYRRGFLNINWETFLNDNQIKRVQKNEKKKIVDYIYYTLGKKRNINDIYNSDVNKLIVTSMAKELQIKVTNDFLFSSKETLLQTVNLERKYISKPISGDSIMSYEDFSVFNYTTLIDFDTIEKDKFYPSLVQEYIQKKYELRIFYLHGNFYTMAIFSQKDNQTDIDYRNYNQEKPNRRVPFKLPDEEEGKLRKLMERLNLNCGSIDVIVTPENDYVFLEVNPIGQFSTVSYMCNYNLEKRIADFFKDEKLRDKTAC